jgi:hypothetical protein
VGLAVVLKVLHPKRYVAEHLVFAAHLLSFSYILSILVDWPIYAVAGFHPGPLQKGVMALTIGIQLVYIFLAQRRFYTDGAASAAFKTAVLWIIGRWAVMVVLLTGSLFTAMVMTH